MTVITTYASAELGIDAPLVTVEVAVSGGLPRLLIVGLPETAVRESKDRVKAAILSSGYSFPADRQVTINLAPADLPKSGGRYDLAIALAILAANGSIPGERLSRVELLGELSLTGELRGISGVLPAAIRPRDPGMQLILPAVNGSEAALAESDAVFTARSLGEVVNHFACGEPLTRPAPPPLTKDKPDRQLSEIRGQAAAKRALIIAAAGGHNLIMIGPPGTGKTMLASRLPSLLPPMSPAEALCVACLESIAGQSVSNANWRRRPFRTPHHTASAAAMIGGSNPPKPGEISLAHHGVLFLDELPEYARHVLEVMREPLETGEIVISRAGQRISYPADFQLVSAMNPCPCGYHGDTRRECTCTPDQVHRYRSKLSGPLLDRIDLHIEVPPLPEGTISGITEEQLSIDTDASQRDMVKRAREGSLARQGTLNACLNGSELENYCLLDATNAAFLENAVNQLGISTRGYFKILKVARTIADLSDEHAITRAHLAEALSYRRLDRARY